MSPSSFAFDSSRLSSKCSGSVFLSISRRSLAYACKSKTPFTTLDTLNLFFKFSIFHFNYVQLITPSNQITWDAPAKQFVKSRTKIVVFGSACRCAFLEIFKRVQNRCDAKCKIIQFLNNFLIFNTFLHKKFTYNLSYRWIKPKCSFLETNSQTAKQKISYCKNRITFVGNMA